MTKTTYVGNFVVYVALLNFIDMGNNFLAK